jgi:hypothetical protein
MAFREDRRPRMVAAGGIPGRAVPRKRGRIWLVLIALSVVLASVAAVAFVWWHRDGRFEAARRSWQPASDRLSSLMRDQPVAGWRASATDLGLPAPVDGGQPSRLAVSNETFGPRPFIGSVGDNAYFLATSDATQTPQWWLVGIDAKDGKRLFPAVPLSTGTRFPQCFVNGPTDVLCLSTELTSATAWVVDAKSGAMIYNGPTDLRVVPAPLVVEQVGYYAVAKAARQGVYGIGHHAETTWFVPGDGTIQAGPLNDVTSTLAAQESADKHDWNTTVFDVSNGSVVKPEGPEGAKLQKTVLYPGGFAAVVEVDDELTGVQFFNEAGKHLASADGSPSTDQTGMLPNVSESPTADVSIFSPDGGLLLVMPRGVKYLVGSTMYLNENASDDFPMWRQYDLKTGNKGPACDFNMRNFLGTDGSVFVFEVTNRKAGLLAKARDLNTCEELWTVPSAVDSLGRIWRINTTLVQLSDDGTELTSLVAPS